MAQLQIGNGPWIDVSGWAIEWEESPGEAVTIPLGKLDMSAKTFEATVEYDPYGLGWILLTDEPERATVDWRYQTGLLDWLSSKTGAELNG